MANWGYFLQGLVQNLKLPQPQDQSKFFDQIIAAKILERRIEKEQEWRNYLIAEQQRQYEIKDANDFLTNVLTWEQPKTLDEWTELKNKYDLWFKLKKYRYFKPPTFEEIFPKPKPKPKSSGLFNIMLKKLKDIKENFKTNEKSKGGFTPYVKG